MNRAVVAARHTPRTPDTRVSRNPAMRAQTVTAPYGFTGTRRHGNKASMSGAQRNHEGRRSEWTMTAYVFTDPKWSTTATKNRA